MRFNIESRSISNILKTSLIPDLSIKFFLAYKLILYPSIYSVIRSIAILTFDSNSGRSLSGTPSPMALVM